MEIRDFAKEKRSIAFYHDFRDFEPYVSPFMGPMLSWGPWANMGLGPCCGPPVVTSFERITEWQNNEDRHPPRQLFTRGGCRPYSKFNSFKLEF